MARNTLEIAKSAFDRISRAFPHLSMRIHTDEPVDLSMDIPAQEGLKFDVHVYLHDDELHLVAGHFWLEWFPCTKPEIADDYVDAVCGLLSGKYRILEHYRDGRAIKAKLQAPKGGKWKTIGTWATLSLPSLRKKQYRVLSNAQQESDQVHR